MRSPRVTPSVAPLDFFFLMTSAACRQVHVKVKRQRFENVALASAKYIRRSAESCEEKEKKKKK